MMLSHSVGAPGQHGSKRKEIYKYNAPWIVYGMNWSVRPDKRFRLALGSFIEEYSNKVVVVFAYVICILVKLYDFLIYATSFLHLIIECPSLDLIQLQVF